ncbi:MAG: hypothetical protein ACOY4I_16030 [Bacillota bacterium]
MSDLDMLVMDRLMPFRERALDAVADKYPHVFSMADTMLSGGNNMLGMQVTGEDGRVEGRYTFKLDGVRVSGVERGAEIHHPFFGTLKPYVTVRKRVLENVLEDERGFIEDPFAAIKKYLPELEIKFMH